MATKTLRQWDYNQGLGEDGPFGYLDGWFVNWAVVDGKVEIDSIERDIMDEEDPVSSEDEVRERVESWLARETAKENDGCSWSLALGSIRRDAAYCHPA